MQLLHWLYIYYVDTFGLQNTHYADQWINYSIKRGGHFGYYLKGLRSHSESKKTQAIQNFKKAFSLGSSEAALMLAVHEANIGNYNSAYGYVAYGSDCVVDSSLYKDVTDRITQKTGKSKEEQVELGRSFASKQRKCVLTFFE